MEIKNIEDLKRVVGEMHDSEFIGKDLNYDSQKKTFNLKSRSSDRLHKFHLAIYNVEEYTSINLDKVNEGKATGGVFNDIGVKNQGLNLEIISQDLRIKLRLGKLAGSFNKFDE